MFNTTADNHLSELFMSISANQDETQ